MLVAGSVIIGRREEGKDVGAAGTAGSEPAVGAQYSDEPDAPPPSVGSPKDISARDAAYEDSDEIELEPQRSHDAGCGR